MQIFHMIYYCLMISLGSGISSNSYKVSHEWLDVLFNREQQNTQQKERSYPKNYNNCYTMTTNIMNQLISIYQYSAYLNRPQHKALGNNYRVCGIYSPELHAKVYCVRLNFLYIEIGPLQVYGRCYTSVSFRFQPI